MDLTFWLSHYVDGSLELILNTKVCATDISTAYIYNKTTALLLKNVVNWVLM